MTALYRNPNESPMSPQPTAPASYNLGNIPPLVNWTVVIGDSASFRIYVEDDLGNEVDYTNDESGDITGFDIKADFRRYTLPNNADLLFSITPYATEFDDPGEFTVTLSPQQSKQLRTGDVFDVQLSDATRVWTVCQGEMIMIGEVTDQES
jgi:hypothetical protein